MNFKGPNIDKIKKCSEVEEPTFIFTEERPVFHDGYRSDLYYDDDDKKALLEQTEIVRLFELDARETRRNRLQLKFKEMKDQWKDEQNRKKQQKNYEELARKLGTYKDQQESEEEDDEEEEPVDQFFDERPQKQANIKLQEVKEAQLRPQAAVQLSSRQCFQKVVKGLLVLTEEICIVREAVEVNLYDCQYGKKLRYNLKIEKLRTGEIFEISFDQIRDSPITQNHLNSAMRYDVFPSRKALVAAAKNFKKYLKGGLAQSGFLEKAYNEILNGNFKRLDEILLEYENQLQMGKGMEDPDEALNETLEEYEKRIEFLKQKQKEVRELESQKKKESFGQISLQAKIHRRLQNQKNEKKEQDFSRVQTDDLFQLGESDEM